LRKLRAQEIGCHISGTGEEIESGRIQTIVETMWICIIETTASSSTGVARFVLDSSTKSSRERITQSGIDSIAFIYKSVRPLAVCRSSVQISFADSGRIHTAKLIESGLISSC
jgi:hypothetical protein